jgi:hypothetical protein
MHPLVKRNLPTLSAIAILALVGVGLYQSSPHSPTASATAQHPVTFDLVLLSISNYGSVGRTYGFDYVFSGVSHQLLISTNVPCGYTIRDAVTLTWLSQTSQSLGFVNPPQPCNVLASSITYHL